MNIDVNLMLTIATGIILASLVKYLFIAGMGQFFGHRNAAECGSSSKNISGSAKSSTQIG